MTNGISPNHISNDNLKFVQNICESFDPALLSLGGYRSRRQVLFNACGLEDVVINCSVFDQDSK